MHRLRVRCQYYVDRPLLFNDVNIPAPSEIRGALLVHLAVKNGDTPRSTPKLITPQTADFIYVVDHQ